MHFVKFICTPSLHHTAVPSNINSNVLNTCISTNSYGTDNFVELIKASRSIFKQLDMLGINGNTLAKSDGAKHTGKYKTRN